MNKGNKVVLVVLIVLAVVLGTLGVLVKTGKINLDFNNNSENTSNGTNNEEKDYIKTTSDKVKLNVTDDYIEYAEISIEEGALVTTTSRYKRKIENNTATEVKDETFKGETKTFTIDGEKVKYIYTLYYQPGANTYVLVLTEKGNVYLNNVEVKKQNIDSINNFTKTKYTNVEGIIKVEVDNSNSEAPDPMPYYYAAIINNETVRIDYNDVK